MERITYEEWLWNHRALIPAGMILLGAIPLGLWLFGQLHGDTLVFWWVVLGIVQAGAYCIPRTAIHVNNN